MEKTLQAFEKMPAAQRAECISAFAKFASMNASAQAEFLKNAARWSEMSPAERQTWRDLVVNVPQWPPMPIGFVMPIPGETNRGRGREPTIENANFNFNFHRRALSSRRASDPVSSRFVPGPFVWRDDRAGVFVRAVDGHAARPRAKISGEIIADVTLWIMVGAILGARVVYVATYWKDEFADQPLSEIFMIQHGGLVFYGGLIGAIIAGTIYLRWKKLPLWKIADVLAPSIALGSVFGRTGCLLNVVATVAPAICRGPSVFRRTIRSIRRHIQFTRPKFTTRC